MREISGVDFETLKLKRGTSTTAPSLQFYNNAGRIASIHANADGDKLYFTNKSNTSIPINFGCDTAADLASLLGEQVKEIRISSTMSLNDYTTPGNYFFNSSGDSPQDIPSGTGSSFFLKVEMPFESRLVQTYISVIDGVSFIRIRNSQGVWMSWKQITN